MEENYSEVATQARPLKGEDNTSVGVVKDSSYFSLSIDINTRLGSFPITREFHSISFQSKLKYISVRFVQETIEKSDASALSSASQPRLKPTAELIANI
jgi:hypothetical protein